MKLQSVLLIGGTGFLGRHLANQLSARGIRVIVPTRRIERAQRLYLLPTAQVVQADIFADGVLERLCQGVDAVVNLVGVLHSRSGSPYGSDFARAHVELPRRLVAAATASGVRRLVHVSALGADVAGPSEYLRSKADGEAAIRAAGDTIEWTIFRPSVVFGPEDRFLNLFASLTGLFPVMPLGGANARFQPVFVGDVSRAILAALERDLGIGETHELAGPKVYTLAELVRYAAAESGHRVYVIGLHRLFAMMQAQVLAWLPGDLMSPDNVRSMDRDNVASGAPQPFGLAPTALEAVAPAWLGGKNLRRRFDQMRAASRDES
ncbi:complex I NDUFA9 subunit family protein [Niveibacterium umoris]|uniref:NADH dehydrogenase n=1 Tax=Niveibacterium umoris TaxID=1193620 RepID=A0A840BNW8_9RHOO|nr:complex I NDUFA9 subunit family protein [Niveibacterium umoris]MBB4013352.1 NADH dehydrogenase [Niveibacterium umoris]